MIALLGATGYTGKLIAAELARRGLAHRLGGRSAERLAQLPRASDRETFIVDVDEPAHLDEFLDGATALITTVGPFLRLGMPAVEAAVRNGVPYVDTTGEGPFMQQLYERFADAPVPVVPACGMDVIPGDLAAAIAMADLGTPPLEVGVHYQMNALPSRGTARTVAEVVAPGALRTRRRRVPFPDGVHQALEFPVGEAVSVGHHAQGAKVVTTLVVPGAVAGLAEWGLPAFGRVGARLLAPLIERMPEGPSERLRKRARVTVLAEAIGASGRTAVITESRDVYGLTARFIVEATQRLHGRGAMAPAEALDPVPFFQAVAGESETGSFAWRRLPADS